jgi:hypothetical protein
VKVKQDMSSTGVVTSPVKSTAKTEGQAVEGTADVGTGAIETVTALITNDK